MKLIHVMIITIFVLSACGTQNDSSLKQEDKKRKEEVAAVITEEKIPSSKINQAETGTEIAMADFVVRIEDGKKDKEGRHHSMINMRLEGKIENENNISLSTTLKKEDKLLTGERVRFEYWKEGEEKHVYLEAFDQGKGVYSNEIEAVSLGVYNVNVHFEKDDIHVHKPFKVVIN
jgi:hypothetical protein